MSSSKSARASGVIDGSSRKPMVPIATPFLVLGFLVLGLPSHESHDLDLGSQDMSVSHLCAGELDGISGELILPDVLYGFIGRTGRRQGPGIGFRVSEL